MISHLQYFQGKKKCADKHDQFYNLWAQSSAGAGSTSHALSLGLCPVQVPPMERAVLLHTKVSIPLTIFLFDLLGFFSWSRCTGYV